jgi:hypothetical protein
MHSRSLVGAVSATFWSIHFSCGNADSFKHVGYQLCNVPNLERLYSEHDIAICVINDVNNVRSCLLTSPITWGNLQYLYSLHQVQADNMRRCYTMLKGSLSSAVRLTARGTIVLARPARYDALMLSPIRWQTTAQGVDKTIFDTESEMFQLRRRMGQSYAQGNYHVALDYAVELKDKAVEIMGKRTTVYASALNNIALMVRYIQRLPWVDCDES